MEDVVELICKFSWPARNQIGTSQKTIGRPLEPPAHYQMPSFSVSLLRDADAFKGFCEPYLTELSTQVQEPWEVSIEFECDNVVVRRSLPPLKLPLWNGPFPADQLRNAHNELRVTADHYWTFQLQTYEAMSIHLFKSIGVITHVLHDLYYWLWGTKDGVDLAATDDHLRTSYTRLARSVLEEGDDETAAQYAKIAYDLSPTDDIGNKTRAEFTPLISRWSGIEITKENVVKKVSTVAREGVAEWHTLMSEMYFHDGLIAPITDEVENIFLSGVFEERRQQIRNWSATHPNRRGLELMEKIQTELGLQATASAGMITEFPLEELRRRVPASTIVEQIRKDSPWAPDTRLEKLAELSYADIGRVPFTSDLMPFLKVIHAHLDIDLPGIMTFALEQLPDT